MNLDLGYTRTLIKEGQKAGLLRNQLAYLLATAYWETARTMKPVAEAYWVKNAETWRKKNLRYYPWYGRGYVQLTWEANYKKASEKLGVDLIKNKDLAMDPVIAAKIAIQGMIEGWFTGKKLSDYITLHKSDFIGARKIINGTDKDKEIAKIAQDYDVALKALGEPTHVVVDDPGVVEPETTEAPVAPSMSFLEAIVNIFKAIFKGGK